MHQFMPCHIKSATLYITAQRICHKKEFKCMNLLLKLSKKLYICHKAVLIYDRCHKLYPDI